MPDDQFIALEVHPVVETHLGYRKARRGEQPSFWSLYGQTKPDGTLHCIGDFESADAAKRCAAKLGFEL